MQKIILIIFTFLTVNLYSQNITITNRYDGFGLQAKPTEFYYLANDFDSLKCMKIASIKETFINTKKTNLKEIFNSLQRFSNNFGANSFKVESKDLNTNNDSSYVILTVYYTNTDFLKENFDLYPKNYIYIFGSLRFYDKAIDEIIINNNTKYVGSLEYLEYKNVTNETVKINVGGILGDNIKITGEEDLIAIFFKTNNAKIKSTGQGAEYSNGSISRVETNFGFFLFNILKKSYKVGQ